MDLTALTTRPASSAAGRATPTSVAAVGGRTQWEVGGEPSSRRDRGARAAWRRRLRPRRPHRHRRRGHDGRASSPRCSAKRRRSARSIRARTDATVGGVLAVGLSGHRRLRYGPLRDRVLEVRFVTADGRLVKGGGPTVKNVSGFDIPRLLVGSFGTIGVLVQVILRCQPAPEVRRVERDRRRPVRGPPPHLPAVVHRVGRRRARTCWSRASPPTSTRERRAAGRRARAPAPPALPDGAAPRPDLGRAARASRALAPALDDAGVRWLAEVGVGHRARRRRRRRPRSPPPRAAAERRGGWLLREAGAPGLDGFGRPFPNARAHGSASAPRSIPTASSAAVGCRSNLELPLTSTGQVDGETAPCLTLR